MELKALTRMAMGRFDSGYVLKAETCSMLPSCQTCAPQLWIPEVILREICLEQDAGLQIRGQGRSVTPLFGDPSRDAMGLSWELFLEALRPTGITGLEFP